MQPSPSAASQATANRLAKAASPYLRQHQHNPVDWYEWGAEAIDRAKRENKPIFLSIGYAACHWCHVMAHESFEDPNTAAVMNRLFINIKVDREERPDIDDIYMQATTAINQGQGGWPMSVWLTPDLKPFFAGTYYPPASMYGRPGFRELCERIGELWNTRRADVEQSAARLTALITESRAPASGPGLPGAELLETTADVLVRAFDSHNGGISGGGTNKFPPSMALDVMLRVSARREPDDPLRRTLLGLVTLTLDRMAAGGIYDQLAGGIHRYSTDVDWLVPHFEKMLYDQALVSRIYIDAWLFTGNSAYADTARGIFDYVLADLTSPEGGFYSSRDADSDGREGRYYVWTRAEVLEALGRPEGELFCDFYDVTPEGNWQDPHEPGAAKSILRRQQDLAAFAARCGRPVDDVRRRLDAARRALLERRARRTPPALDDKVLCEWNGLMISSLARGGAALNEPRYVRAAARAADFVLSRQFAEGRLRRSWRAGQTLDTAFLSDYAAFTEGLIDLYEATFDPRWLQTAEQLLDTAVRLFSDEQDGAFYFTAADHAAPLARRTEGGDGAVPSGSSLMLMNLLRLSDMLGRKDLRDRADRQLRAASGPLHEAPWSYERMLAGVEFADLAPTEIAVVGNAGDAATQSLLALIRTTYIPNRVLMLLDPDAPQHAPRSPLLEGRARVDGKPAVFICRNYACRRPVTTPDALRAELAAK